MRYIKTNIGDIPIEDYREIYAIQNGFDSYADMRSQGYYLENDIFDESKGDFMEYELRSVTKAEQMYTYTQSQQIRMQTGCIGFLRANMDTDGDGFLSTWNDFRADLKTQEFKDEFDSVIQALREDGGFLSNRSALTKYCYSTPEGTFNGDDAYGVRVNTQSYTYLMRLNPNKGEYNLYCYCYRRDWLDHHLAQAERGIRFIDSHYNEQFRLVDGGKIQINRADGSHNERKCRYIDDYHVEVDNTLFHICEFAESLEKCGNTVQPLEGEMQTRDSKKQNRGDAR